MTGPFSTARGAVVALATALALVGCASSSPPAPTSPVRPAERPTGPTLEAPPCPDATTTVHDGEALQRALDAVKPGDVIELAAGTYAGPFDLTGAGTADEPIFVCGPRAAVIEGRGVDGGGAAVRLSDAAWWVLSGFSVRDAQKGVVAERVTDSVIADLEVSGIGDEAIHLRAFSSRNSVLDNTVADTGQRRPRFGEGIYVGTAQANWCAVSDCDPDASDGNVIAGNRLSGTTAEAIDVKEGTTGGLIAGNTFDGSSLSEADSWVDVKGNDWLIRDNHGTSTPGDGFQVHQVVDGWGSGNTFTRNTAEIAGSGYGFAIDGPESNVVACDNTVIGTSAVLANVECDP